MICHFTGAQNNLEVCEKILHKELQVVIKLCTKFNNFFGIIVASAAHTSATKLSKLATEKQKKKTILNIELFDNLVEYISFVCQLFLQICDIHFFSITST